MKLGRTLVELAVLVPGIGMLFIALLFSPSDAPVVQLSVRYWWTVVFWSALVYGALRIYSFLKDRGYVSL